jgi:3-deoxy-D-manno-octulosonic-acid transferase
MRASVHTDAIRRLFNAGAATHVSNETDIAETLLERIAPHATAEMALAGWEVATNGAELIDQLTDVITDHLDHHGRQNAGA